MGFNHSKSGEKRVKSGRAIKIVLGVIGALLLLLLSYLAYVYFSYYRLEDNIELKVDCSAESMQAESSKEFSVITYNVGLGIYSSDFGFFMDGGSQSRAVSKEEVLKNLEGQISVLKKYNPDFILLEETALNCTCNYGVNMYEAFRTAFSDYDAVAAQCWDSPYLFYPFSSPFGKAKSCLTTLSRYSVEWALRRSLPLEKGVLQIIDLDRCYSRSYVVLENGKYLVLFVIHPSAYTSDGTIANDQIKMLMEDAQAEYQAGNYVIIGGDWNKDIEGDSDQYFGVSSEGYTWAQNIDSSMVPQGFSIVSSVDVDNPVATARNADGPYDPSTQLRIIIDGFIVSNNVNLTMAEVIDTGFGYSDHNPVYMTFTLH